LQPWKFIVVTDPAVRAKLLPASYGQAQITDASHLVVFAAKKNFSEADVDAFINHSASARGVSVESLAPFRGMLVGGIVQAMNEPARDAWARNQAYIALGNLLTSAALLGIDACPMEGFDRAQYDEILGLNKQGFASAVIATLGYRAASDQYAAAPKVRFAKEQIFAHV
jgi:nitroreductase